MSERSQPRLGDRAVARAIDVVSKFTARTEATGHLREFSGDIIVGIDRDQYLRWHVAQRCGGNAGWHRTEFGDKRSGRVPATQRSAMVLEASPKGFASAAEEAGGRPAAAFKVGEAVVAGEFEVPGGLLNRDGGGYYDDLRFQVALGIGRKGLEAALGSLRQEENGLYVFEPDANVTRVDVPTDNIPGVNIDRLGMDYHGAVLL